MKKFLPDGFLCFASKWRNWAWLCLGLCTALNFYVPVKASKVSEFENFLTERHAERKNLDARELLDIMQWKLDDPQKVVEKFNIVLGTPTPLVIRFRRPPDSKKSPNLTQIIKKEIKLGTRVHFEISTAVKFKTQCTVSLEGAKFPHEVIFSKDITLSKTIDDDPVEISLVAPKTMEAGQYAAKVAFKQADGEVDFVCISLVATGRDEWLIKTTAKIAPDQLAHRIDHFRKGNLKVSVVDSDGKAIPNAEVRIEQTAHKFLFGSSLKDFRVNPPTPIQTNYEKRFLQLFNYAVIPFTWEGTESEKGKTDYKQQQQLADWCSAHHIAAKGSPIFCDWASPSWLPTNPSALSHVLRSHLASIVARFGAQIKSWDVIMDVCDDSKPEPNGLAYWLRQIGGAALTDKVLEWSKSADQDPNRQLIYTDWECPKNRAVLNLLEQNNNLPDAIGLETRLYEGSMELSDVWRLCEAYKRYGKPLHFTQVTILSGEFRANPPWGGSVNDWYSTASGEAKQADYAEQFYTILFSHPSVESITWWDICDREADMGAPGGLLRKDGTPKLAFERLRKLIHEQWWTKTSLNTDEKGNCATRAFWGSYIITVNRDKGPATRTSIKFYDEKQLVKIVVN